MLTRHPRIHPLGSPLAPTYVLATSLVPDGALANLSRTYRYETHRNRTNPVTRGVVHGAALLMATLGIVASKAVPDTQQYAQGVFAGIAMAYAVYVWVGVVGAPLLDVAVRVWKRRILDRWGAQIMGGGGPWSESDPAVGVEEVEDHLVSLVACICESGREAEYREAADAAFEYRETRDAGALERVEELHERSHEEDREEGWAW